MWVVELVYRDRKSLLLIDGVRFTLFERHGHTFTRKLAVLVCVLGTLVRFQSKSVLFGSIVFVRVGAELGAHPHVGVVVWVPETVLNTSVDRLGVTHLVTPTLVWGVKRSVRHRLHAPCDNAVVLA